MIHKALRVVFIKRKGSATCGADESDGDGAPSDVNFRVCYRFIDYKREISGFSWVPGCLQKGHLEMTLNK